MSLPTRLTVVCIPAFNEEASIAKVLALAMGFCDRAIVCDDGSTDLTATIAERMGATVIRHERNLGYGAAIRSLLETARQIGASVAVTLDADGQHEASEIPVVAAPVLEGKADVVIGSRFLKPNEIPRYREVGVKVATSLVTRVTGLEITDAQSGFRAYSPKALQTITVTDDGMGASTEILQKASAAGLVVAEVPIIVDYQVASASTQDPVSHFSEVIGSTLKHYSIRHPLLMYGIPGLIFIAIGLAYGFDAVRIYSLTYKVAVGSAIIAIGSIIIGILLGLTGMILFTIINVLREKRG